MSLSEENIRSLKRRRLNDKDSEEDKETKLHRKLHHALRDLRKVVKKARTFEVQKTLKKLKEARRKDSESDVIKDLEAQLETLKHLSYDQLAHSALTTKLKKDKILSANPQIQAISVDSASNLVSLGAPGTPTARVQSRILSSKALASGVTSIVETLKTFLHPSVGSIEFEEATDDPRAFPGVSKRRRTEAGHEEDAFTSKDDVAGLPGKGSDREDNEAIAEADDGWESGTVGSVGGSADDHDSSSDGPDDVTSGQGSSDEDGFPSETAKSKKPQPHGSKGQSEFLPSLSVGFTRGDSGSEFSDGDTKFIDGTKRNRRGQRARRAIWEKKFGRNANHVKKRQQQEAGRGSKRRVADSVRSDRQSGKGNSSALFYRAQAPSRAPARGYEQVRRPTLGGSEGVESSASTRGQSGSVRRKGDLRDFQEERPLHPSWEAKRKQKAANIVPSQGTKIVFS